MQHMLTTIDNPFDPFDRFDDWYRYDEARGYCSSGLIARIALTSDELSPGDQALAIEAAIDEIVSENILGLYKKVSREF